MMSPATGGAVSDEPTQKRGISFKLGVKPAHTNPNTNTDTNTHTHTNAFRRKPLVRNLRVCEELEAEERIVGQQSLLEISGGDLHTIGGFCNAKRVIKCRNLLKRDDIQHTFTKQNVKDEKIDARTGTHSLENALEREESFEKIAKNAEIYSYSEEKKNNKRSRSEGNVHKEESNVRDKMIDEHIQDETSLTEDEIAARILREEARRRRAEAEGIDIHGDTPMDMLMSAPILLRNSRLNELRKYAHGDTDKQLRIELKTLPDMTSEGYQNVPIHEFGLAMLYGMGYDPHTHDTKPLQLKSRVYVKGGLGSDIAFDRKDETVRSLK